MTVIDPKQQEVVFVKLLGKALSPGKWPLCNKTIARKNAYTKKIALKRTTFLSG